MNAEEKERIIRTMVDMYRIQYNTHCAVTDDGEFKDNPHCPNNCACSNCPAFITLSKK